MAAGADQGPPSEGRHVVAMPYPGRGHINPMLVLARLLASRAGFAVTVVVTEEWLHLLSSDGRSPFPQPEIAGVRFRTIPNVIPSEHGRAADLDGFLEAVFTRMEGPFERLLDGLRPPPVAIVADTYLPWAVAVGNRRHVPVCSLFPMSASFFSVLYHYDRLPIAGDGRLPVDETEADDEYLRQYIPGHNPIKLSDINSACTFEKRLKLRLKAFSWAETFSWVKKAQCLLFTSFYELECNVMDALRAELPCPVYPIGPSIPYTMLQEKPNKPMPVNGSVGDYLGWLDSQPMNSVLYVSLGSFMSVSGSQLEEIAMGLHASETRFLWVARGDSHQVQEMVGSMGLVVPWCDQLRVLSHPSVGGFLTHCGWNSTLEGIFTGVPMLTFPIGMDQAPDSRLIVEDWKVGLNIKEKAGKDNIVRREEIAKMVKRLMDLDGVESKEMRRRASELQEASHQAIGEGGSSYTSFDSYVKFLLQGHA